MPVATLVAPDVGDVDVTVGGVVSGGVAVVVNDQENGAARVLPAVSVHTRDRRGVHGVEPRTATTA